MDRVAAIKELYYYCETSPSGLRRARDWCCGRDESLVRGLVGDVAGSKTQPKSRGGPYYIAWIGGGQTSSHTLVWELHNGELPEGFTVDHADGNTLNNRIENLRLVDDYGNARNHGKRKDNKTGVTGVRYDPRFDRYVAGWYGLDGKPRSRSFAILKFGKEEAFRLACAARAAAIEQLNEQGAGYTERHGT